MPCLGIGLGIASQRKVGGQSVASLEFHVQPGGAVAGVPFTQQPVVRALDGMGAVVTGFTGNITISIHTGTGVLSGTLVVACVAGVATFTNLALDTAGNFTLHATDGTYTVNSASFTVPDTTPIRTGLILELIADTTASEGGVDGSEVASATDTSGQGNNATQATSAARPTLKTAIINGHAVYRFDGVDDFAQFGADVGNGGPFTCFAVYRKAATGNFMVPLGPNAATLGYPLYEYSDGTTYSSGTSGYGSTSGEHTSFVVTSTTLVDSSCSIFFNGISQSVSFVGLSLYQPIRLVGARSNTEFSAGDIAEILLYSSALSTGDRQAVEDYLVKKYFGPGVRVSGAGTDDANGIYTQRGTLNAKPYYNKVGQPDSLFDSVIQWNGAQWFMLGPSIEDYYDSLDDVATPDLATFTTGSGGSDPAPTVTILA